MRIIHFLSIITSLSLLLISCNSEVTGTNNNTSSTETSSEIKSSSSENSEDKSSQKPRSSNKETSSSSLQSFSSSSSKLSSSSALSSSSQQGFLDPRDNEHYKTTTIGKQTWMAQDLRFDPETGSHSCPLNSPTNCNIYGRLYSWSTAMGFNTKFDTTGSQTIDRPHQGICPEGWHIPSKEEWLVLAKFVHASQEDHPNARGIDLISPTGWNIHNKIKGTDKYGFAAKGSGMKPANGAHIIRSNVYYWTDEEVLKDVRNYSYNIPLFPFESFYLLPASSGPKKVDQISLRCIQNS